MRRGDALGDVRHAIEGAKSAVAPEPLVFRKDAEALRERLRGIGKPAKAMKMNYHIGSSAFGKDVLLAEEGMPEFAEGEIYSGMLKGFAASFGKDVDLSGPIPGRTIPRDAADARMGPLQITRARGDRHADYVAGASPDLAADHTGRAAIDARPAELETAKKSGATTFLGAHGGAPDGTDAVDVQIVRPKTAKDLLATKRTKEEFAAAMKPAHPRASGEESLRIVADRPYSNRDEFSAQTKRP